MSNLLSPLFPKSFKAQLIYGIGLILTFLIVGFTYIVTIDQSDFLKEEGLKQASNRSLALATTSKVWIMANDYIGLEEVLHSFSVYDDLVFATVINLDAKVIAHTDRKLVGKYISDEARLAYINEILEIKDVKSEDKKILLQNRHYIDIIRVIKNKNQNIGFVNIRLDQIDRQNNIDNTIIQGVVFTVLSLIIAVLFAFMTVNGLVGELLKLIKIMKKVELGDRDVKANEDNVEEVSKLAHEFNSMLDALNYSEHSNELLRERLELAISGSQDGLWDWNIEEDSIYYSPKYKEMLGYRDMELMNSLETWQSRVHPDDLDKALKDIEASHSTPGIEYKNTYRLRHKDGHWVWILSRGQTIFDHSGKAIRMIGFHTDISEIKELETQLRENEQVYYDFFEHTKSANIMYETDDDGKTFRIKTLNSFLENLENVKKKDLIGRRVDEVFPGVEKFGLLDIFRDVYKSGKAHKMPLSVYEDDTKSAWRENYIFRLSNGNIVASYEDKTKEKELEILLSNTINSVDNMIFVKDKNFRYLECNGGFEKFIGLSREELIGKEDYEIFDKEVADAFRSYDEAMLKSGNTKSNYEWVTYPDGSEVYLLTVKAPLRDTYGTIIGLVGNAVDLTKEKRLEDELRSSKQEFEKFMEYVPGSILIKDEDLRIIYANKMARSFFNGKDIVGLKSEDLLSAEDAKTVKKVDERILAEHYVDEVDEYTNYANEKRVYRTMGFLIEDESENKTGTIIVDITDEYTMRDELHNKEELMIAQSRHAAMGEMISMIAHQWRQPISVIAMDANNILADIELEMVDESTLKEASEDIVKQTQELSKTIDDFRNFFRPQKEADEVRLKELFDDAFAVIGKSLENSQVEVSIEVDENKMIRTFSRELMQVFINIIKNAKEALIDKSVKDKKISIVTQEDKEFLSLKISDNAGGVNVENIDSIFDPYFTTKGKKNGTGLGLYMSKTIVEKHLQGYLSVSNDDEGACFEIKIPHVIKEE